MGKDNVNIEGIGVETVGETIHRERLTRNIQIETVAEDLKLKIEYIRGIEESDYSDFPVMPYIRIYIKTIAEYLEINPDELLERFSEEQNLTVPDPENERRDTISVRVQGEKKQNPIWPIIFMVTGIVIIIFLLRKPREESFTTVEETVDSITVDVPSDTHEVTDDSIPKPGSTIIDTTIDESSTSTL